MTANIFEVVLARDFIPNGVEIEALDVPGKAGVAVGVGDAPASSIKSSAGVVSL